MVKMRKRMSLKSLIQKKRKKTEIEKEKGVQYEPVSATSLSTLVQDNLEALKEHLGSSTDFVTREFRVAIAEKAPFGIAYIDGLANGTAIQDFLMESLMSQSAPLKDSAVKGGDLYDTLRNYSLTMCDIREITKVEDVLLHILSGDTALFVEGYATSIVCSTKGWKDRAVAEPEAQTLVRGPRDGFNETLRTNTALVRRRIKSPHLWMESMQIGRLTKTDVAFMYMKGIADEKVVNEVRRRLKKVDIDSILESAYIEELIQDEDYTPFPTIQNTERPDAVAAGLLEGRIAIFVDGTPFVLIVPALFIQFFQSSEDYYQRADISSLIRLLRFFSFFLALMVPSVYIALTTFHQEMIPFSLLVNIAAQREGVPFPAVVEALLMEVTFEILREAGVRMPRAVGSTISIVGALVLGEAAVQAGIVSPAMIIVVAATAISSFVSPSYSMSIAVRMIRFILMILAATFGLFGIILGLIFMVLHLCSLRSFGIPYMTPMAPFFKADQKDALIRRSWKKMLKRPSLVNQLNVTRQKPYDGEKQ